MQNEPNFRKSQVNVRPLVIMNYERKSDWTPGENEPKTNPIKANLKRAQMNVNSLITKDYRKNDAFAVQKNKPKQSQFQTRRRFFCLLHKRLPRPFGPGSREAGSPRNDELSGLLLSLEIARKSDLVYTMF